MLDTYTYDTGRTKLVSVTAVCTNPDCSSFRKSFKAFGEIYMGTLYADLECPECVEIGELRE
jgi:hypothetical protein